jgi:hypothetical protein
VVTSPRHGDLADGDPSAIWLHVTGTYSDDTAALSVQILGDPQDMTSWTTIASTHANHSGFALDVQPITSAAVAARWPSGGILRLRVVADDGTALLYDPTDPSSTVIAITNPSLPPLGWTYLEEKPDDAGADTAAYYQAIAAPTTLAAFMQLYGFGAGEATARYYNAGDLGIGRDMHCKATTTPVGGVACYVRNYGVFEGSDGDALAALVAAGTPLATVVMVYAPPIDAPNAVSFIVYDGAGNLQTQAKLDVAGNNQSIPQNCINCHGGQSRYDATAHAVTNARFLLFDPASFEFAAAPLDLASQADSFRALNRLVQAAGATDATTHAIDGMFPQNNSPYDATFVPAAWSKTPSDARVYREALVPFCRSCHTTMTGQLAFETPADLRALATNTVTRACGSGPHGMPAAQQTSLRFFSSPARALLVTWLGAAGACEPK